MLQLDFHQQLGSLELRVQSELPANGITAIFGVSGAGKTSLINAVVGLTRPDGGRIVLNNHVLVDTQQRVFYHRKSGESAMYFRMLACFRTIACAVICATAWLRQWNRSSMTSSIC